MLGVSHAIISFQPHTALYFSCARMTQTLELSALPKRQGLLSPSIDVYIDHTQSWKLSPVAKATASQ